MNHTMDLLPGISDKSFTDRLIESGFKIPHNSENIVVPIAKYFSEDSIVFCFTNNTRFYRPEIINNNCLYSTYSIGFIFTYKIEDEKRYRSITIPPKKIMHIHHGKYNGQRENEIILDSLSWKD